MSLSTMCAPARGRLCGRMAGGLLLALAAATGTAEAAEATEPRRAVELTFLKSKPGQREPLRAFIVQNWLEMDRVAKLQGLMSAYTVMDTGTDEGPWNVLVAVTYRDERGYEGIAEAFEKIRRAHVTVPVDGKRLPELGAVVDSKRLFEAIPAIPPPAGG